MTAANLSASASAHAGGARLVVGVEVRLEGVADDGEPFAADQLGPLVLELDPAAVPHLDLGDALIREEQHPGPAVGGVGGPAQEPGREGPGTVPE